MSTLIIDGAVSEVLPAVHPDPNPDIPLVETYSRVIVKEVLSAVAVAKPASLFIVQEGGRAGKWEVVTPQAPLPQKGDRYILFLQPDNRRPFYDPATPRYNAVGFWSGLVKVTNGRVNFLPDSATALRGLDNMTVDDFLALVLRRVDAIMPKNQIILTHPIHVPPEELERARRAAGEIK
jgi:hypothetical protein